MSPPQQHYWCHRVTTKTFHLLYPHQHCLLLSSPEPYTLHNRSSIAHATTKSYITATALLLSPPKPCISATTLLVSPPKPHIFVTACIIDCCHHQTFRHKNKKEKTSHEAANETAPNPSVSFPSRYDELYTFVKIICTTRSQSQIETTSRVCVLTQL